MVTSGVTHRWTGPEILGAIILTCPLLVAEPVGVGSDNSVYQAELDDLITHEGDWERIEVVLGPDGVPDGTVALTDRSRPAMVCE